MKTGEFERQSRDKEAQCAQKKEKPLGTQVHNLISMQLVDRISHQTGFKNMTADMFLKTHVAQPCLSSTANEMASSFSRVSKTPMKILRTSVDNFCRVCNVSSLA